MPNTNCDFIHVNLGDYPVLHCDFYGGTVWYCDTEVISNGIIESTLSIVSSGNLVAYIETVKGMSVSTPVRRTPLSISSFFSCSCPSLSSRMAVFCGFIVSSVNDSRDSFIEYRNSIFWGFLLDYQVLALIRRLLTMSLIMSPFGNNIERLHSSCGKGIELHDSLTVPWNSIGGIGIL